MKPAVLWIVGKELDYKVSAWEFQGLFSSEAKAVKACRTGRYFIAPQILDKSLPDRRVKMKGAYYPKAQ